MWVVQYVIGEWLMSKIIIIGANQGALVLGELLGKQGYDVTLYEKCSKEDVSYPWHDNMSPSTFVRAGLPIPPKSVATVKDKDWFFIPPTKQSELGMKVPEERRDIKTKRRPLNDWLYERTKDYAKINYGVWVKRAVFEGERAVGVELGDGTFVTADLVVDCSGANSVIRENLPLELGFENKLDPNCTFQVRRIFVKRNNNAPDPKHTHTLYMRHLGEKGITWVADDKENGVVDVLVGRTGELSDETYKRALDDVMNDFPIITDEITVGGELVTIPIRHVTAKLVADGFVLLGDSAFMTIPMMGSGMASSILAAKILSEVLAGKDDFSKENLYRYQVQFMKENGGKNSGIDVLKNWMIDIDANALDFLMNKKIIGEKEFSAAGSGNGIKLGFSDIMQKVKAGFFRMPLLFKLISGVSKMKKQMAIAAEIPTEWDEKEFNAWRTKYEANFKN